MDVDSFAISGPADLGASRLTSAVPAAAPIYQSPSVDRLVIVYRGIGTHGNEFFWTYLGDPSGTERAMGPLFNSDLPPSLVAYPYFDRVYFLRGNFGGGTDSRHILYASYTIASGWTKPFDLTRMYDADGGVFTGIVRTFMGLSLAEYALQGPNRLNFTFVTAGGNPLELWHGSLIDGSLDDDPATTPGQLVIGTGPGAYRAVPLIALGPSSSAAAGGLAAGTNGGVLWHFWMVSSTLSEWRKHSN
jgi:hypothetical protein